MPYPYPLSYTTPTEANAENYGRAQNLFQYGVLMYALGYEKLPVAAASKTIHMYQSVDDGVTWALVDDGNAPSMVGNLAPYTDQPSAFVGKVKESEAAIIVVAYAEAGTGQLAYCEFNMIEQTWGTPVTGGPVVLGTSLSDNCYNRRAIPCYRYDDDVMVFIYNARTFTLGTYDAVYTDCVIYDVGTATWGAPFAVDGVNGDGNRLPRDLFYHDATSEIHIITLGTEVGPAAVEIRHCVLDLANTLTAIQTVVSDCNTDFSVPVVGMASVAGGAHIAIPYLLDNVGNPGNQPYPLAIAYAAMATVPVWTSYPVGAAAAFQFTTAVNSVGGWQITTDRLVRSNYIGYWSNPTEAGGKHAIESATFNTTTLAWSVAADAITYPTAEFGDWLTVGNNVGELSWLMGQPYGVPTPSTSSWKSVCTNADGSVVFAADYSTVTASQGRLFLSYDQGVTWTETQPTGNQRQQWFAVACDSTGTVLLAVIEGISGGAGRVYYSLNGGTAWSEAQPNGNVNQDWRSAAVSQDGTVMLVGATENILPPNNDGRLWMSIDSGTTWAEIQPLGDFNGDWVSVVISQDKQTILAVNGWNGPQVTGIEVVAPPGVYASYDQGVTWADVTPGPQVYLWKPLALSADGLTVITGTSALGLNLGRLYLSVDGGTIWNEIQPKGNVDEFWYTASMSYASTVMMVGTAGRKVWLSTDSGVTWAVTEPVPIPLDINPNFWNFSWTQVAISGDGLVYAATENSTFTQVCVGVPALDNIIASEAAQSPTPATPDYSLSFWRQGGAPPPGTLPIVGAAVFGGSTVPSGGKVSLVGAGGAGNGYGSIPGGYPAHWPGYPVWPPQWQFENDFDRCLLAQKRQVRKFRLSDQTRCIVWEEMGNDLERMPREGREFYHRGSIVTPAPAPADTLVMEFTVPTGYLGILYGITLHYTGTGFEEGSGDIIWRVKVGNSWAAQGLGNCLFQLGTVGQCLSLTDYIATVSNQRVQVLVNVPNTSGNIQVGASRILATIQGWWYPL